MNAKRIRHNIAEIIGQSNIKTVKTYGLHMIKNHTGTMRFSNAYGEPKRWKGARDSHWHKSQKKWI